MSHEHAWTRLPDLLEDRDEPELLAHAAACHACHRQLFLLGRVDRLLRDAALKRGAKGKRARRPKWPRFPTVFVAAVGVAACVLVFVVPKPAVSRAFTLRAASGRPIGQARLSAADHQNIAVQLIASGLPTRRGAIYLLWARGSGAPPVAVGRFMVSPNGSCRARFNLPAGEHWTRLWVTPPGQPDSIVATT